MPMMYTSCGAHAFSTVPGTTNWADTNTPYSWQSGYYNCSYPFTPSGPGGCFKMPPNTWMTFYYSIQLGGAGQPNSHITAWVGPDGQLLQKFMDVTNMPINFDEPGYNAIYFNVYMTGFNGAATNPAANAWLDEVIVSTQPIAAPAVNSGTPPPPSSCDVNGDGQINVADVQLEVNMALGISTCANPSGTCTVASVQRVVNAALGGTCVSP
jgi:hypothetical protein